MEEFFSYLQSQIGGIAGGLAVAWIVAVLSYKKNRPKLLWEGSGGQSYGQDNQMKYVSTITFVNYPYFFGRRVKRDALTICHTSLIDVKTGDNISGELRWIIDQNGRFSSKDAVRRPALSSGDYATVALFIKERDSLEYRVADRYDNEEKILMTGKVINEDDREFIFIIKNDMEKEEKFRFRVILREEMLRIKTRITMRNRINRLQDAAVSIREAFRIG